MQSVTGSERAHDPYHEFCNGTMITARRMPEAKVRSSDLKDGVGNGESCRNLRCMDKEYNRNKRGEGRVGRIGCFLEQMCQSQRRM